MNVFSDRSYCVFEIFICADAPASAGPESASNTVTRIREDFIFCSVPLEFGRAAAKRSDRWIRATGAPEARFARGFWPASTGRSVWTALRAARSRQSWFGLRVAVGVHAQGLRLRSKAEQHTDGRGG